MTIIDSAEELLESVRKPVVAEIASNIQHVTRLTLSKGFPDLKPLDIGLGIFGGAICYLQKNGVSNGTIADLLRRIAAMLDKTRG